MPKFLFHSFWMALALILCLGSTAQALDIKDIRFGVYPEKVRIVIDLSAQSDFRSFMLPKEGDKPYRLVIDMPDFNWQAGSIPWQKDTSVTDIRSGTLKPGIKRIVADLDKPAQIMDAFILPKAQGKPDRLVIDFKTITPAQFNSVERRVLGTLKEDNAQLNLLIAKQTANDINAGAAASASAAGTSMIIPPRKPGAPESFNQSPSPAAKSPLRKPLIMIDAGHGGADPGAVGSGHLREKNITLAAAKELKRQLEATGRYRAALTRSGDQYLKLYSRVSLARTNEADLFISLHADSIDKPNVRGASIYTLSNKASDSQTAKLAARENQVDLIAGVDLSHEDKDVASILIDLAMRDTMNQSKFFANTVVSKMRVNGIQILERPHRYAGFAVLKAPDIPSVLVEMGFMSNQSEARLLATSDYQRKIASALTQSIDAYFEKVRKNSVE